MTKIILDIADCSSCPHVRIEKVYTGDSFEDVHKWTCSKHSGALISYHEMNDKEYIPHWCPIKAPEQTSPPDSGISGHNQSPLN